MAVAQTTDPAATRGLGATDRKDPWWIGPVATALGFGAFIVYATFRAIYNKDYVLGTGTTTLPDHSYLLSPFYSPLFAMPKSLAWLSPAFLILWAPGGFRVTCYYYRKAYYRAFFLDPVGCAVGEPGSLCGFKRGKDYKGETRLLIFQNIHRYFMYLALGFLVLLSLDVVWSCIWPTAAGGKTFGVSVATLVLAVNVTLLTLYTTSCHSFRHLVGGRIDQFSRAPLGNVFYRLWTGVSTLNQNHMLWAWCSLFSVGFADFYVWLVASGTITDLRLF